MPYGMPVVDKEGKKHGGEGGGRAGGRVRGERLEPIASDVLANKKTRL